MSTIGVVPAPITVTPIPLPAIAIPYLIKSLVDLGIQYHELTSMRTCEGKIEKVDVLIKGEFGKNIGFQKTKEGKLKVLADTSSLNKSQLKKQKELIKRISQRYMYNKVIDQLKKEGYIISEEEKIQNNTIRILARKWS